MTSSEYKILQQHDIEVNDQVPPTSPLEQLRHISRTACTWLIVLLLTSLSFNTIWVYQHLHNSSEDIEEIPTLYAGLVKSLPVPFNIGTDYTSSNRTIEDEAWKSASLVPDQGVVALSDDFVRSKNLPTAQRFPWDKSKGLYILNGFHDMHCLHILRKSILEAFEGEAQANPREHVTHCLNIIREAIMCDPDDTPRYTGRVNQQASAEHPESGVGQIRMCKDWSQFQNWAIEHSACYKAINFSDPKFPPIERYKFCPNGEKLWP